MRHLSNVDTVAAYGRLLEYSSNKRYGVIKNDFSDNAVDKIALEFNHKIEQEEGLNILILEDDESILKYEDVVDNLLTDFTYKHIIGKKVSDEKKFYDNCMALTEDLFDLNSLKIEIPPSLLQALKKHLNTRVYLNDWTNSSIEKWCKTPSSIYGHYFENRNNPRSLTDIFLNKSVEVNGRERIFFAHISIEPKTNGKKGFLSLIGFFSEDDFGDLLNTPIGLFFEYIHIYGNTIEILGEKKKFFYDLKVPNIHLQIQDNPLSLLKITYGGNKKLSNPTFVKPYYLDLYYLLNCVYSIRGEENIVDTLKGTI